MTKKILIIGDFIIDRTRYVNVNRISPEAPVPTAALINIHPEEAPGGAGFAAAFSAAQGNDTILCSIFSSSAISLIKKYNINILTVKDIDDNIVKERIIEKESGYHLIRIDNDQVVKIPQVFPETIIELLSKYIKGNQIDACVLADYKKGFFNNDYDWFKLIDYLISYNIHTILDTRMKNIRHFMDYKESLNKKLWLKLNEKEADQVKLNLYGEESSWDTDKIPRLLITQGSKGLTMISEEGYDTIQVPKEYSKIGIPDTTGCGDIFDVSFIKEIARSNNAKFAAKFAVKIASKYAWIPFKDKLC